MKEIKIKKSEKQSKEESLISYYQDNLLLKSKITLLSVSNFHFPDWAEKILLFWEYTQLMSQSLLLYSSFGEHSLFERMIIYFFKLINPSYFLEFKESGSYAWSIVIFILVITALKYLLMGYMIYIAYCNKKGQRALITIWRWMFRFQARFTCFFLTSFWTQAILNISETDYEWVQGHKTLIIVILSILIAGEYLMSFLVEIQFCDMMPRKSFLSGKNNEMQLLTLTQKMALQVLELVLKSSTKLWICCIINLLFSIWRVQRFTLKLPLYQSKALYWLGNLISLAFTLHIVNFIAVIVWTCWDNINVTMQFLIILWILIGLFGVHISKGILQKALFRFLLPKEKYDNPAFLLHRVIFSKELEMFERLPQKSTEKYHSTYLFRAIEKFEFARSCGRVSEDFYGEYLEELLLKSQDQDPLIRIYITKIWFKQFGICFKVLRIAADILANPWSKEYTSYILLLDSIQRVSLKARKKDSLDLAEYIEKQKLLNDVKTEMIKQVQMKKIICQNMLNNICDVGEIFDQAQLTWKSRKEVQKKVDTWLKHTPEYWTTPLLIFSEYYLVVEFSPIKCQKYQEMYTQRFLKNEKYFLSSKVLKENIYQDLNVFLLLGGVNSEMKFCSRSIEEVCGDEKKYFSGLHVTKLFISSMQPFYKDLFKRIIEQGETSLMQKTHRVILLNRKGYLLEADFCLWIHPNIFSKSLYLNMILRPMNSSSSEFLVIRKNGDIEGATKYLSRVLGLKTRKPVPTNIKMLSEELASANETLNIMLLTQKDQDEFQFSTGKDIEIITFTSIKARFHCRMMSFSEDLPFIKLLFFAKPKTRNGMEENEFISNISEMIKRPDHHDTTRKILTEEKIKTQVTTRIKSENDEVGLTTKRNEKTLETERNLLTNLETSQQDLLTSPKTEIARRNRAEVIELNSEHENDVQDFVSTTSISLKTNEEDRNLREIKRILEKKTSSDVFKVLSFTFYVVVILSLVSQLVLMRIFNSTMDDLVVKKNLLNNAQTRAYYTCKITFTLQSSYLLSVGIDVYSFFAGGTANSPATLNSIAYGYYLGLATANNNIIKLLGDLDGNEILLELFQKDVRVIGSMSDVKDERCSNFTSFQVVEQLGLSMRYLLSAPAPVAENTTAAYQFLIKNGLGDFLAKNEQVTEIFKESVSDQRDTLNQFIWLCIILNPLAQVAVCLTLNLIIWRQYLQENKHLKAFIKLDPNFISSIAESMKDFKQALLDDRNFEDKQLLKAFWDQSLFLENRAIENHHSLHNSQVMNLRKTKKRYILFAIQMGVYIAILVGVLLWNFLSMKSSLNIIYTKQSQLELSNYISETSNVDMMGMVQMFTSNNTWNVSGLSPLVHTRQAVKELENMRDKILTGFQEDDGSYDPAIKKIVFEGESCSVYNESLPTSYCVALQNKGVPTNLVSLSTFFESFMTSQLSIYENLESPSIGELIVGLYTRANDIRAGTSLLSYIAQRLNGIIDDKLTKSIADTTNKQTSGMIIFTITLVIVSAVIWIQILSKIKEANNDFKKVLLVFPTKLVASSFLLKKFIDQFSKHIFE